MTSKKALVLLLATAAFTPLAAAMGLYESSLEDIRQVAAPMLGAACALGLLRLARARTRERR